jgi:hypothetical protein
VVSALRRQADAIAGTTRTAEAQALQTERWKRAEYVAAETKAFLEAPRVRRVLGLLDNTIRVMDTEIAPGSIKPVTYVQERGFLAETPDPDKHVVLIDALQPHEKKPNFTRLEAMARDDFDFFMNGLERFERLIKSGLIAWSDIEPYVDYWVNLLNGGKAHPSRPFLETVRQFMLYYQYTDALAFLDRGVPKETARSAAH